MAKMFDMAKKAASMQKQMKKVQKELARQTAEGSNGAVTAVARGDMSLKSVRIDGDVSSINQDKLEKMIVGAVNSALNAAKKMAGGEMSKITGGMGGLSDMLQGM